MKPDVVETQRCWADKRPDIQSTIPWACDDVGIPPLFLCWRHWKDIVGATPDTPSKTTP